MSRTYRAIPKSSRQTPENLAFLEAHGLIDIPKMEVGKSGRMIYEEVWKQKAKRLRKHLISKRRREDGKSLEKNLSD